MKLTVAVVFTSMSLALGAGLPRSTPEEQGISSAAIRSFAEAASRDIDSLHSFMVVRHGKVVAEGWWAPYSAESPHALYSLSKSFTSTAVGLAISEGKLSLDDEVLKFFPEDAPAEPSANLKAMRVRDLLRMNSGQETEPPRPTDSSWKKAFLNHPVAFKPGTHFLYNTSGTYMLAAIVEKVTGMSLLDYLTPRLFEPLGIEHPTWEKSPEGINTGGFGLSIRTEDIARFGQLYLQKGKWQGKQLVPSEWVTAATTLQTSNGSNPQSDWDQGYCYQFWRCRHDCFRGDGAFGQYCIVMPHQDAVVAITSGVRDMQAVMNLVWDKLMPAMGDSALPADHAAQEELATALRGLMMRLPEGTAAAPAISGKVFKFPANTNHLESLSLDTTQPGAVAIEAVFNGAKERVEYGLGTWKKGQHSLRLPTQPLAAAGAWTAPDTFTGRVCLYETPFVHTLTLKFADDKVRVKDMPNVGFGASNTEELVGEAVP